MSETNLAYLAEKAAEHLQELAGRYPDRSVGSPGNLAATAYFADVAQSSGFRVARTEFDCIVWEHGTAVITVAGVEQALHVGPYSMPCDTTAPLVVARTIEELESETVRGAIVLIAGDLARGQLMPRNFTFYNPESHKRVYRAIDEYGPAALIAATGRDLTLVGPQYPFNVFEDGDLHVPNAYLKDVDGERLLEHAGQRAHLRIDSSRIPSTGEHVVATRAGRSAQRVVVFGHIDSKKGARALIDNAVGTTSLLLLAELLKDSDLDLTVELVPLNGEDDYANPGEMLWVAENEERMDEIVLGMNVDDAGRLGQRTEVSFYDVPDAVEAPIRTAMLGRTGFEEGEQWFMSDHSIFGIYGRPAIAVASSDMAGFMETACHTERDTIELVDFEAVAQVALFMRDVITSLDPG